MKPVHTEHHHCGIARPASWSARLSTEQLRFYFLHQMNPADPDIYICRTLRTTGALDCALLRESVRDLARRHDILRSCYPRVGGQPQILLRDDVDEAFLAIDLTLLSPTARAERGEELEADELRIRDPFLLEQGPLFRVTAIALSDQQHALVFRFHHIILDGTSVRLFLNALWETYRARSRGTILDRPRAQFRDFIEWESKRLANARTDRDYWERKLDRPAVLDLTIAEKRPDRHTREAGTVQAVASPQLVASLRSACRELHVTPFMVMMAVFQILLHRVTGRQDVLVGTPIACRPRVEFLPMLGVLLNWIAFRGAIKPEMTFRDVLSGVREEFPEAYERQCSYDALISAAGRLPRDPSRNPLFQVTLNYASYNELSAPSELSIALDPIVHEETHYDLSVRFEEIGDSLSLGLTFYRGAMSGELAEQLGSALLTLAQGCLGAPDRPISEAWLPDRLELAARREAPHRILIASTFTANQILPALEHWLDRIELRSELELAPCDQVFQALLAADGRSTNVVLVRCEDWKCPESAVAELCALLRTHAERNAAETIVVVCPPSEAIRASGAHDRFDQAIAGQVSSRLHVLSWRSILAQYPVDVIDDADSDAYAKAPYSEDFNVALGTAIARKICSLVRPRPKVIVLDCDHTLWRGVVGEDGADALVIDHGRRKLQQLAIDRLAAGILPCLVSKNEEADVWEAFARAPGMLLKREMIVAHRINWARKSQNIASLAAELNLGLDSFLFIDDSPAECAEVRSACPGVLVLELPADEAEISRLVDHFWPLDLVEVTDADRSRAERYATHAQRERLRGETRDLQHFIESLEVKASFLPCSVENLPRAAQLTQRTNQFNTTTIRRTEAELRTSAGEIMLVDVSDRFGDYGLVGMAVHRPGVEALEVESFLLSCRALGRGVEQRMLAELGRIARARGLDLIDLAFRPTARNRPALQFLEAMAEPHRGGYRMSARDASASIGKLVTAEVEVDVPSPSRPVLRTDVWREIAALDSIPKIRAEIEAATSRPRSAPCTYRAPRDQLEATIARAWSEALSIDPIGVHDDYFAIGGDSIRSLTVVSKMRKAGLPVSVLELHQRPTIDALAQSIRGKSIAPAQPACTAKDDGPYPLSFSQRYIVEAYARENLEGEPSGAFHIQDRLVVQEKRGHSIEALRRAIELLVSRTPTLRAELLRGPAGWIQAELAAIPALEILDLASLDPGAQQARTNELLFSDRMRPFDPERSVPMIRFYAIVKSANELDLVVSAHHGFCDGWSLHNFYNHLFALYGALRGGDQTRLAELERALAQHERSFRELVDREQRAIGAEPLESFWRNYLPSRCPPAEARERPRSGYQQRLIAHADPKLIARANERARASHTSMKAVLLEAFSAVFARKLEASSPPVLAVVTNGRKDDLTAPTEIFGLCWTLVPIVAAPGDRSTRLSRLHQDLLATEAHARYPIEEMFHGRESSVRASFNLTRFHNAGWRRGTEELEVAQAESFHRFHFPLNFSVSLADQAVILKLSWSKDAFDASFARALLDEFPAELEAWD